jgi:hypothetical protein
LDGVRRLDLRLPTADDIAEYLAQQSPAPDRQVRRAAALLRDQTGGPFTGESQDHISVYEVTAAPAG